MSNVGVNLGWIAVASIGGFAVSAVFAGVLELKRNVFLLFYVPLSAALLVAFALINEVQLAELISFHWIWGLVGAVIAAAIVVRNVFSQQAYPRRKGPGLFVDILWPGLVYGVVDGLLLSVLPILAVQAMLMNAAWTEGWIGRIGGSAIALAASLIVTAAYHLGYPEFRGKRVWWAVLGNAVLSLAYLITLNPLAAVLPHAAMHIAAIVHGRETTIQLPPHYSTTAT